MENPENKVNEVDQENKETVETSKETTESKETVDTTETAENKVMTEKKVLDLYYVPASGPCRAVQMGAKAFGVELNLKYVNLLAKDQLKPDYIKINPQHTVPTLVDGEFILWESRAILTYLAEQYGTETNLYPTDHQKRALINQRLYFDLGTLYQRFGDYFYPQLLANEAADPENLKKVEEALQFLNAFLENHKYAAGEELTIADISLLATVSTIDVAGIDINQFENVKKWYDIVKTTIPGHELNEAGLNDLKTFVGLKKGFGRFFFRHPIQTIRTMFNHSIMLIKSRR